MKKLHEIDPKELDVVKLRLLSLASLCGMGIGILIGHFLSNLIATLIIASILFFYGLTLLIKGVNALLLPDHKQEMDDLIIKDDKDKDI